MPSTNLRADLTSIPGSHGSPSTLLLRSFANSVLVLRYYSIQPDAYLEPLSFEVKDTAPNPEEAHDLNQRQLNALCAIRSLDPHLRAPIQMRLMHGWSLREISRALDLSESAVKACLYRARRGCRWRIASHSVRPLTWNP